MTKTRFFTLLLSIGLLMGLMACQEDAPETTAVPPPTDQPTISTTIPENTPTSQPTDLPPPPTQSFNLGQTALVGNAFETIPFTIQGEIVLPEGDGPFPVVMVINGEEPATAVPYLLNTLAEQGYIAIAPDVSVAYEGDARRRMPDLIDRYLQPLAALNRGEFNAVDGLAGRVDLSKIALIGLHEAGEGIFWTIADRANQTSAAQIAAGRGPISTTLLLAPTVIHGETYDRHFDIPLAVLKTGCDGDMNYYVAAEDVEGRTSLATAVALINPNANCDQPSPETDQIAFTTQYTADFLNIIWNNGDPATIGLDADQQPPSTLYEMPVNIARYLPSPAEPALTFTDLSPWAEDGLDPTLTIVNEVAGACWIGSLVADRADAWRCASPNDDVDEIHDPCFVNLNDPADPLACVNADETITLLTLTEPLDETFANREGLDELPVKLTLADGDTCGLLVGATITYEGKRANYGCESGGILFGEPTQEGNTWFIDYSADGSGADATAVAIASAYAFNGDTATVGEWALNDGMAQLVDVSTERLAGLRRTVFSFDGENLPAYMAGYVNETAENAPEANEILRLWFVYGSQDDPDYDGAQTITVDDPNIVGAAVVKNEGGDQMWFIGLNQLAGFEVTRQIDPPQIILDIYDPLPFAANRPELGIGSTGEAVEALQTILVEMGYLTAVTNPPIYDQPTRQAVVAFQAEQGLIPNGVVGPETWAALEKNVPATLATTARRQVDNRQFAQSGNATVTPSETSGANVRSGPGLNYDSIGALAVGDSANVLAVQQGDSPTTTWYQICCINGQQGWVRGDVVLLQGSTSGTGQGEISDPENELPVLPSERPTYTSNGRPIIYFTFDDGPSKHTYEMLDLLEPYDGTGTFFVIGQTAARLPQHMQDTDEAGSAVQNHTYDHPSLDQVTDSQFINEVESTQTIITDATERVPLCLRPPYGATDDRTANLADSMGLEIVLWTVDTQDWRLPGAEVIAQELVDNAYPGAIMLMHDGGGNRTQSVEGLTLALPVLAQQNYLFGVLCR